MPAGGLILAPEGYSTCICPYNYKTSLALVPVERYEDWSIYLAGRQDKRSEKKQWQTRQPDSPQITQRRLNLNAPGDPMDTEENVWLAYPRAMGDSRRYDDTILPIELRGVESRFRHHTDLHEIQKTEEPWLFTSGVEGAVKVSVQLSADEPREYRLELLFAETDDVRQGERVFDIKVQGVTEITKLDIVASSGGRDIALSKKLDRILPVDGKLDIELIPRTGKPPRICGTIK